MPCSTSMQHMLRRELCQALSSHDPDLVNVVVTLLAASEEAWQLLGSDLEPTAGAHGIELVAVTTRGRAGLSEVLVGPLHSNKVVAVHFEKLLEHASLEQLLELARKVQVHMSLRTQSMSLTSPTAPANKALAVLEQVSAAALHFQGQAGSGHERAPTTPSKQERFTSLAMRSAQAQV